jgi:hypothetical protein
MQRTPGSAFLAGLIGAGLSSAVVVFAPAGAALAGQVTFQLGEQDFSDGQTPVWTSDIRSAGAGEPYPFDGTIFGDDERPVLGQFQYVHEFDLAGATATSARLTIGLLDLDSPPEDDQGTIALYFNGVRQSAQSFVGISDRAEPSSAEVVSVPVPLDLLADGHLTVTIQATEAGPGQMGNSVEADFSRLVIQTTDVPVVQPGDPGSGNGSGDPGAPGDPPTAIPLPPAFGMASVLVAGIACVRGVLQPRWRRRKR